MLTHHVNFRVRDPRPMLDFYRALGFELFGAMDLGELHTLYLRVPGDAVCVELTVKPDADDAWLGAPGTGHLALSVPRLLDTLAALAGRGIGPVIEPYHPGGRPDVHVCFLADPMGNKVELIDGEFTPPREPLPFDLAYG